MKISFYHCIGKRIIELIIVVPSLIILSPLLFVIALLVRLKLGSPVMFRQPRPGLRGKPFAIYKFRTMTDVRDADGNLLSDTNRLTDFGRFLRSTSLDELPELFNVIKGEMSLVGPRPLHIEYLPLYTQEQRRRQEVRPGITGLAQIGGRNSITWEDKFKLDVEYVNHLSLWLDLKILFITFIIVFRQEGINASETITMPKFTGTKKQV